MNYNIWPGIGLTETPFDWAKFTNSASLSAKSTASVDRRRKTEGKDFSTFHGMSKPKPKARGPKRIRNRDGKRGPVSGSGLQMESKAGKIRAALIYGPKTRAQLSAVIGIKSREISAFLKNDIRQGRILKIVEEGSLQRFALAN
jgi:hypothetical protein